MLFATRIRLYAVLRPIDEVLEICQILENTGVADIHHYTELKASIKIRRCLLFSLVYLDNSIGYHVLNLF